MFALEQDIESLLESGSQLVNQIARQKHFGLEELFLDRWTSEFPMGGFHLNLQTRTLEFWIASAAANIEARIRNQWLGWNVVYHRDCFEFQLARTKGKLRFPLPSQQTLKERIKAILLVEERSSSVERLLEISERDRQAGHQVEINPWALREDRLELELDRRKQILSSAFAEIGFE